MAQINAAEEDRITYQSHASIKETILTERRTEIQLLFAK